MYIWLIPMRELSFRGQESLDRTEKRFKEALDDKILPAVEVWMRIGKKVDEVILPKLEKAIDETQARVGPAGESVRRLENAVVGNLGVLTSDVRASAKAVLKFFSPQGKEADLDAAVPAGGGITPWGLVFDEDADVTIKSLVAKNALNVENQRNLLPNSAAGVSLAALNRIVQPKIGRFADLSPEVLPTGVQTSFYPTSQGFALTGKFDNAVASPKTITVLIVVENQGRTRALVPVVDRLAETGPDTGVAINMLNKLIAAGDPGGGPGKTKELGEP